MNFATYQDPVIQEIKEMVMAGKRKTIPIPERLAIYQELYERGLVSHVDVDKKRMRMMYGKMTDENMTSDQFFAMVIAKMNDSYFHYDPNSTVVNVHSWSNITQTYKCWGDFWAWKQLVESFTELGYRANNAQRLADVTIYLRGGTFMNDGVDNFNRINRKSFNILWIYSHPDDITKEEVNQYDAVMCLSQKMVDVCSKWHKNVCQIPLTSCSDMEQGDSKKYDFDVVFVGNARGGSINDNGRDAVYNLKVPEGTKVGVWGMKWDLPNLGWMKDRGWWQGKYLSYYDLKNLYASAKVVVNDTHPDMSKWGFIPMKIYDIAKAGGVPLTDHIEGIEETGIPFYKDWDDMNDQIAKILARKTRGTFSKINIEVPSYLETAKKIIEFTSNGVAWTKRDERWRNYISQDEGLEQ